MKKFLLKLKLSKSFRKAMALALATLVLLQGLFVVPAMVDAANSATDTTSTVQDGITINIKKSLTDLGNNLYKLTFSSESFAKNNYQTYSRSYSEDGYFVADASGYYLVELWGGTGGRGADTIIAENNSGYGGNAGYVYGYLWMEQGETLVYTIGTNGMTVSALNIGGGANGDGGEHGDDGSATVGTGGGFSAVYYFKETRDSISMTTQERLSSYILIAGGGGGGGGKAAAGLVDSNPNGGKGGDVDSSLSGTLSVEDNNGVAGTYFRGSNGQSSTSSTAYVGRGGSSVPGAAVSTLFKLFSSDSGNDWTGTFNTNYSYGAGGNGNFRGGGGGAGFCGGSGGIMEGEISPLAIGGGGGGSSFIADNITYTNLSERVKSYLHGVNGNTNTTDTGGACVISYLGNTANDVTSTEHLSSCMLSGSISTYFDIESVQTYSNGTATVSGQTITVSGIDISPSDDGYVGNTSMIDVFLRPKDGFAGGNNVPVVGNTFTLTPNGKTSISVNANSATDYCNVPLMFKASPKNYMIMADELPITYVRTDLYTDEYTERSSLSSYWQYDFISSISSYSVYSEGSTSAITSNITVTDVGIHNYKVAFTVVPDSTTVAAVGTPVETTEFSDTASITVVTADAAGTLNNLQVDATKLLSHDGTNYDFSVEVNQKTDKIFVPAQNLKNNTTGTGSWEAHATGWYYLQVWGGNGGGAGASTASQKVNGSTTGSSASGGSGGYYSGYIFLEEGDMLYYTVGSNGNYGSGRSVTASGYNNYQYARGSGGGGGTYSSISLSENSDYLLIAGGGGGAGGSAAAVRGGWELFSSTWLDSANARAGASSTAFITDTSDLTAFNGTSGTNGTAGSKSSYPYVWATAGTAGNAGSNYRLSGLTTGYDTTGTAKPLSDAAKQYAANISAAKTNSNGQINITLIETPESRAELDKIYDLSADGTFSRYFDVIDIEITADSSAEVTFTQTITENENNTTSWHITDLSFVPNVSFEEATVEGISGYYVTYSSGLNINFAINPKDGFIGGNDVPLVQYGTSGEDDTGLRITQGSESLWLKKSNTEGSARDLVNVDINYTFEDNNFTTQDETITCGETVDQTKLIITNTIPLPSGEDAWKAEFVKAVYPQTTTVAPTQTTTYTFTQSVEPIADAQYATVIPQVNPKTLSVTSTVFVEYSINTEGLINTEYDGPFSILDGEDLNAVITAKHGYDMPESIEVTVGGATLAESQYTYNASTGAITLLAEKITGNITISAQSLPKEYSLTYVYPDIDSDGNYLLYDDGSIKMLEYTENYIADEPIILDWYESFTAPQKTGYEFTWEWETDDGLPLSTMPAQDWYVVGSYTPLSYDLTINYYKVGTTEKIADSYTTSLTYQTDYSVVSPEVTGYTPDFATVTGILTQDTTIDVYYTPNDGKLTVFYIYTDSNTEVQERFVKELATDESYTIQGDDIPEITGYTPDKFSVEITMPATGGVNVYIYYNPNSYTVTFDADGGTLASGDETKEVIYNNIYGYNLTDNTYSELPQPLRNGFEFVGWQDVNGNLVGEETVVTCAEDHTLYAVWKAYTFKLTIYYQYADGTEAQPTVIESHEYGTEYKVTTPEIIGYTPNITEVSGTMGAGNRVVFVTYSINIYSITVNYVGPNGESMSDIDSSASDYYTEQEYNSEYSITSPVVPGYTADTLVVEGIIGTADVEITVNYEYIDYTLTVNYVIDDITLQPETVVHERLHIGDEYSITTPEIEGYTADKAVVSGTVGTSDIIETVTYSKNQYTLTINYVYGDDIINTSLSGTQCATTVSETIYHGEEYSYASPFIDGYVADVDVVSGTITEDITVTVYYNQVVSVTIEWGELTYNYNEAEWDAEAHEYFIPPEAADSNYVTVTNDDTSTIEVGADITYAASSGFEAVSGYFTADGSDEQLDAPHADIAVGDSIKYWLWLRGIMPDDIDYSQSTEQTTGVCTVTIGGAD